MLNVLNSELTLTQVLSASHTQHSNWVGVRLVKIVTSAYNHTFSCEEVTQKLTSLSQWLIHHLVEITVTTCGLTYGCQALLLRRLQSCLLLSEKLPAMTAGVLPYPCNPGFLSGQTILGGLVHWANCCQAKYSMNTSKSAESNGSPLWQWWHFPLWWIVIPMRTQVTAF